MRLTKLAACLKDGEIYGENGGETEVENLCIDSREVKAGALFFCLSGDNADGHDYAVAAVKNGAVAIVSERKIEVSVPQLLVRDGRKALALISSAFYGYPSERMKVIGITGTNGKTTTAAMLAAILEAAGKCVGVIGTLGTRFLDKYIPPKLTTPDPIELQKMLAQMSALGVEYAVMEVSAHALYYHKVEGIRFCACIFTNLTQDHLDFFPSMREYKEAKSRLFEEEICSLAVINGDEEVGREFGKCREQMLKAGKTLYYGLHTPAEAFALITDESLRSTECMLNICDTLCRVSLPCIGKHNVYNALAAATCAIELGVEPLAVQKGLRTLQGVRGRLESVGEYNGAKVFVDFAHTPDGLQKSLQTLKPHCLGRLVCLFGCGGDRDKSKRPIMGEAAAKYSDFCVLTSDNPRYEDPLDIISDIEKGYRRFSLKYVVVPDRKKAIEYALDSLQNGDVLLVAGKGGEEYQEIMGIKYPFNDNDIIEKIFKEKREGFLL